jgi:hypothetical protein
VSLFTGRSQSGSKHALAYRPWKSPLEAESGELLLATLPTGGLLFATKFFTLGLHCREHETSLALKFQNSNSQSQQLNQKNKNKNPGSGSKEKQPSPNIDQQTQHISEAVENFRRGHHVVTGSR